MTDSDIIQSMKSCANDTTCARCLYQQHYPTDCCQIKLIGDALRLIKRQQAEIERLKAENAELEAEIDKQYEQARADILGNMADGGASCHWCIAGHRKNAANDFAERLLEKAKSAIVFEKGIRKNIMWVSATDIYECVAEMED